MLPNNIEIDIENAAEDLNFILYKLKCTQGDITMLYSYMNEHGFNIHKLSKATLNRNWMRFSMSTKEIEKYGGCFYRRYVRVAVLKRYLRFQTSLAGRP